MTNSILSGQVPWSSFDRRSRWIVQEAVGQLIGDYVSRETLRALAPGQLLGVRAVGNKRAAFAWQDLQRVLDEPQSAPSHVGSADRLRGNLELPVAVKPHDEVMLEDLDHGPQWIIRKLLQLHEISAPACLSLAWLASLCEQQLTSVEGVGPQRAQQFIEAMCARRDQRERRTPAAEQFHSALAKINGTEVPRLAGLKVQTDALPRDFQTCFVKVQAAAPAGTPPLAFVLMASVRELCDSAGLHASEAEHFVAKRDSLFAQHVILRALRTADSDVDITVATHLMIAVDGNDRWGPDTWQKLTGLPPTDLLDSLRRLLCGESAPDHRFARTYLEDLEMLQAMRGGETLQHVGKRYSITRERVRQRIASLGYRGRLEATELRESADADQVRVRTSAETFARCYPGCSPGEMAEGLGLTREVASRFCSELQWLTLVDEDASRAKQWALRNSRYMHLCKVALRQAATLAFPITKNEYDKLRDKKFFVGPSSSRVLQLFRSWRDACDAAGVESGEGARTWGEHHQWSKREMIDAVARFLVDPRHQGQSDRYDEWKKALPGGGDLPSRSTILIHLKASWSEIRRDALIALRGTWQRPQDANT